MIVWIAHAKVGNRRDLIQTKARSTIERALAFLRLKHKNAQPFNMVGRFALGFAHRLKSQTRSPSHKHHIPA